MFQHTEAEQAAHDLAKELTAKMEEAHNAFLAHGRTFGAQPPEWEAEHEALKKAWEEARNAFTAVGESEAMVLYEFKTEANKMLKEKLPADPGVLLTLAEETIAGLKGPTGLRVAALVKDLILMTLTAAADLEIQQARAKVTAVRYKALIDAGLPEDLAGRILVAEAARPWPGSGASYNSKK